MIKRYYLFHPQLKYFCGKKDAKYWSLDPNAVRLFARKCDATNCKVQTDSYWELKDSIVKEVSFKLNILPNILSISDLANILKTDVVEIQAILKNMGFDLLDTALLEFDICDNVLSLFGLDASKYVAIDGMEIRFWENYWNKKSQKY